MSTLISPRTGQGLQYMRKTGLKLISAAPARTATKQPHTRVHTGFFLRRRDDLVNVCHLRRVADVGMSRAHVRVMKSGMQCHGP